MKAARRLRQSRNVVHVPDRNFFTWSLCARRGVKLASLGTFNCLPESAAGKNPRRCLACARKLGLL